MRENNTQEYYNQVGNYFNVMAERFVDKRDENSIFAGMRRSFREHVGHPDPKNILDIGCGPGTDVIHFARKYPNAKVYGIDVSETMINIAKGNTAAEQVTNTEYLVAGIETLHEHLEKGTKFDIIYVFFGALNTVSSLKDVADIITNLLNPGGKAVLTFVNKYYMAEFLLHGIKGRISKATARWKKSWPGYSPSMSLESHTYTPSYIRQNFSSLKLMKKRGYSIFYPAWFQHHLVEKYPGLCRFLLKMDGAANKSPFWKYGEYTLFVYEKP